MIIDYIQCNKKNIKCAFKWHMISYMDPSGISIKQYLKHEANSAFYHLNDVIYLGMDG